MGKPVVATDVRGTRELVENEKTGMLVLCGDVFALAAAMGRLLTDREFASRAGGALPLRVEREFDETLVDGCLKGIYRSALKCAAKSREP